MRSFVRTRGKQAQTSTMKSTLKSTFTRFFRDTALNDG
jgi:hypothetical protein